LALSLLGVTGAAKVPGLDWTLGAVLVGALLGALGLGRVVGALAAGALATMLLVSFNPGLVRWLVTPLIRNDPLPSVPVDAVVVLAGSVSADGRIGVQAADRLLEGIRLVRAGVAPRLLTSRVATTLGADSISADQDIRYFLDAAGPVDAEILGPVGSTRLEAERFAERATAPGWSRIVVVTSPSHTRRACATFAKLQFRVTCRASPHRVAAIRTLPQPTDRLQAFSEWLYETVATSWYRSRGWI